MSQGTLPLHQGGHERFRQHIQPKGLRYSEWSSQTKIILTSTLLSCLSASITYFFINRKRRHITDKDMKNLNIPYSLQRNLTNMPGKLARQNTTLITTKDENNEKILVNLRKTIDELRRKHYSVDVSNVIGHFSRVIVLCVDSSIQSLNAVQWAQNNVLRTNDVVVLVNIWEKQNNFLTGVDIVSQLERTDSTEVEYEHGIKLLKKLYESYLSTSDIETIPCILKKEENNKFEKNLEIAGTLLNAIKHLKPDMVVMGSRGLGQRGQKIKHDPNKLNSYEFGTVSNYVSQQITCPCVIVPHLTNIDQIPTQLDDEEDTNNENGETIPLQPQPIVQQSSLPVFPSDTQE